MGRASGCNVWLTACAQISKGSGPHVTGVNGVER